MFIRLQFRLVALFCALAGVLTGQQTTGAIRGVVTDPSGAFVSGASIVATNDQTRAMHRAATGASGNYVLPLLPPGTYTLSAESTGFNKAVRGGILVRITETEAVDFKDRIGNRVGHRRGSRLACAERVFERGPRHRAANHQRSAAGHAQLHATPRPHGGCGYGSSERAEIFNTWNHAAFGNPSSVLDTAAFGTIRTTLSNARIIQLGLKLEF